MSFVSTSARQIPPKSFPDSCMEGKVLEAEKGRRAKSLTLGMFIVTQSLVFGMIPTSSHVLLGFQAPKSSV